MAETKKLTKKEKFGMLLNIKEVAENEMLVEFINKELELLNKKNGKNGQTKGQKENETNWKCRHTTRGIFKCIKIR